MRRRVVGRWETPLGRFVDAFGAARLVAAFAARGDPICSRTPYSWISGATVPRADHALTLVELARGAITLDAIYRHRQLVRRAHRGGTLELQTGAHSPTGS